MLIASGLPCMYARFAERSGVLGLVGFTCTFFFMLVGMATEAILTFIFPFLAAHGLLSGGPPPLGLLIFFSGADLLVLIRGILLGISVLRAAVLHRSPGACLS